MKPSSSRRSRRSFLRGLSLAAAVTVSGRFAARGAAPVDWPLGCFNRPWGDWGFDDALDGIREAGYDRIGLVGGHKNPSEPFFGPESDGAYLDRLRARIEEHSLQVNTAWLRSNHRVPLDESVADLKRTIDQAARVGLTDLLSGGVSSLSQREHYVKAMREAAVYGAGKDIRLAVKPHGGQVGSAEAVRRTVEEINHPNFKVWFDAGNIVYYTGGDPVAAARILAPLTTGFCAKDCAEQKTDVMIQFGEGRVDFPAVFRELKKGGFAGPVMVECTGRGQSPAETTRLAAANRRFLLKALAEV